MREIKFRMFNTSENKMYQAGTGYVLNCLRDIEVFKTNNEHLVFLQYTGLKDCEGKEIYEGDIIVAPNSSQFYYSGKLVYVGIVEFITSSWKYTLKSVKPKRCCVYEGLDNILNYIGYQENSNTYFKVIGNIYQNKELLNK